MKLSKEAQVKMKEIMALESKYHHMAFSMAFLNLVGEGVNNFDDAYVKEGLKQILAEEEAEKAGGKKEIITPDFKREILLCSAELSKFSMLTLFAYIKKHFIFEI